MNALLPDMTVASLDQAEKSILVNFILRVNSMARIPIMFGVKVIINTLPVALREESRKEFWDGKDRSFSVAIDYFWGGVEYRVRAVFMSRLFMGFRSFVSKVVDEYLPSQRLEEDIKLSMFVSLLFSRAPEVKLADICEMKECISQVS
jgi:hypothetical protein